VGLPMQNVRFKLVDLETGTREVAPGEQGEIIARSPQIMRGYFNKPAETAYALREFEGMRWLFTGDVAKMDDQGYVYIVDRVKDMIIVGGFKVFSAETEETLYEHPAIEYCAIVALIDPERAGNERVKAVIQLKKKEKARDPKEMREDIIQFCRENMAPYKVPKVVEFVDQMPLTAVGKVDKKALR
jgi:acyl-CoA synthetase (AMP-forming)/AMP-acid ligase II